MKGREAPAPLPLVAVLRSIAEATDAARTVHGRLALRDEIKNLLEQEGLWQK